jgi:transcription elongation factor Elf1
MAVKPPAREPHRPTCPYCGDARIALQKGPGRDWWLSCYVCGQAWQVMSPARSLQPLLVGDGGAREPREVK